MSSKAVAVIGTGYVGLPLCTIIQAAGHDVTGFDANPKIVASLNSGKSTVEDVEDAELAGMNFSCDPVDIEDHDVYIICVPTPVNDDKTPDLRIIMKVKETLAKHARPGSLVILESTVGVGDTKRTFQDFVDRGFLVANSPERIDPSRKEPALVDIPKVVGGVTDAATDAASEFYGSVFTQVVPVKDSNHSECTKLLENSYRAVNISFINEMADFCDKSGLDIHEIVDAASTKPYGFTAFRPWVGVGGHCIPVDPHYLIESRDDCKWPILTASMDAMHSRPARLARERVTPTVEKVLIVGVSYKPNVSDIRDAPQAHFIKQLQSQKIDVSFYDPMVEKFADVKKVNSLKRTNDYDKVFVMHKHNAHKEEINALAGLDNVEFFCQV